MLFQHHIPLFISYFTLCLQWEQVSTFVTRNQISRGCVHGLQQLGAGFHLLSSQLAAIKTLRAELCYIFSKLRSRFHNVSGFLIWPVRAGAWTEDRASAEVRPLCCTLGMTRHWAQFQIHFVLLLNVRLWDRPLLRGDTFSGCSDHSRM